MQNTLIRVFLIMFLCINYFMQGFCQYSLNSYAHNGKSFALGNGGIALDYNFNHNVNPAQLAFLAGHQIEVFSTNYFFIKNLFLYSANMQYKIGINDGLGIQFIHDGNDILNQNLFQLSYGRRLGKASGIGLSGNYTLASGVENFSQSSVDFNFGLYHQLKPYLNIALTARNPFPLNNNSNFSLPSTFTLGILYKAYKNVSIMTELDKTSYRDIDVRVGILYNVAKQLELYSAVSTGSKKLSAGVSYILKNNIEITTAIQMHQVLGISPGISLKYKIPKN